jgi:hypothetical protein
MRLTNTDITIVESLAIILTNSDRWRDLECLSLKFDGFDLLLNTATFSILNLKRDSWIQNLLLFGLKGDLDDLLSAWGKLALTAVDIELFWKFIDTGKFPISWYGRIILECQGFLKLLAQKQPIELDDILININNWLCTQSLKWEDARIWIIFE